MQEEARRGRTCSEIDDLDPGQPRRGPLFIG